MVKEGFPFVVTPIVIALIFGYFQLWIAAALFRCLRGLWRTSFATRTGRVPEGEGHNCFGRRRTRDASRCRTTRQDCQRVPVAAGRSHKPGADIGQDRQGRLHSRQKGSGDKRRGELFNERNSLTIVNDKMTVVCTQIAGIVARRIVCWSKLGDDLEIGQKFGLIKFSSRTDLLMPADRRGSA